MVIGALSLIMGFLADDHHGNTVWANILVNGYFFFGISLLATFFMALQYVTESGWSIVLKRVFEGISAYMPYGAVVLVIVFIAASLHWNHIYHWMDEAVTNHYVIESTIGSDHPEYTQEAVEGAVENEHFDEIIFNKTGYLNTGFWWIRTVIYLSVWIFFGWFFRKRSLEEDEVGGEAWYWGNQKFGAIFLVFLAVTSSTSAWDWIMSIDTHWFSTLFGWYVFGGSWIAAMVVIMLFTMQLKAQGYLNKVNESHIHDLGKWVFALSIFWSYLWFCQLMLIWYSDIPEEVTYYVNRIQNYNWMFFGMFIINFLFPLIIFMSRDTKRNFDFLLPVLCIIFVGHWADTYLLIMPGLMKDGWNGVQVFELGMFLGFIGFFRFVVLKALSSASLEVKNNVYLEESEHLDT
ncbi:MAG: quinol:cytochrome C oxidoreductase [Flavobacteriales bacterium]|nr:quinol:cytochrome C oxidoreductase [Flavobacteriales bacterium]